MNSKHSDIDTLIERFLDGETTNAEERLIEHYFAVTEHLPGHLEPYRSMFGWYAGGMPRLEEVLPEEDTADSAGVTKESQSIAARLLRHGWLRPIAAAAVIAVVTLTVWVGFRPGADCSATLYADCYVERDGIIITGTEIEQEIDAAILSIDDLNDEIDRKILESQISTL